MKLIRMPWEKKEKYSVDVPCRNCAFDGTAEIDREVPVRMANCPRCGCEDLLLGEGLEIVRKGR
jgi:hypothetical protein